ncbi:MAG: outer membrane lipoprotein carrier protein LolA [Bacilli bacterium]|nr:outer membrane lipoprotein carrier protein LolA [Bacilli bacterium]
MKKIFLLTLTLLILLSTGCGKYTEDDIIKDLEKKINKLSGYKLEGSLEILNNEEVYNYDVDVSYKKDDLYKVSLTNTSNNYEQIILKNNDGVYVLTPSLNKSFKFQSDWPNNNSQIYLLQSIISDMKNDKNRSFKEEKNGYIFSVKVNYPNNKKLVKQDIYFDKKLKLKRVKVYNEDGVALMSLKVKDIDYSPTFKKSSFQVKEALKTVKTGEKIMETSVLEDTIYPLALPSGTKLVSEEKVDKTDGNRIIMTFDGDKPFLLVEETAGIEEEMTIIPTYGEPYMLMDTVGAMTDNSLTWTSGGIEYYLVSDVLNQQELLEIAQSINVLPTMK